MRQRKIDAFCLFVNTVKVTKQYAKASKPAMNLLFRKYPFLPKMKHSGKSQYFTVERQVGLMLSKGMGPAEFTGQAPTTSNFRDALVLAVIEYLSFNAQNSVHTSPTMEVDLRREQNIRKKRVHLDIARTHISLFQVCF